MSDEKFFRHSKGDVVLNWIIFLWSPVVRRACFRESHWKKTDIVAAAGDSASGSLHAKIFAAEVEKKSQPPSIIQTPAIKAENYWPKYPS